MRHIPWSQQLSRFCSRNPWLELRVLHREAPQIRLRDGVVPLKCRAGQGGLGRLRVCGAGRQNAVYSAKKRKGLDVLDAFRNASELSKGKWCSPVQECRPRLEVFAPWMSLSLHNPCPGSRNCLGCASSRALHLTACCGAIPAFRPLPGPALENAGI